MDASHHLGKDQTPLTLLAAWERLDLPFLLAWESHLPKLPLSKQFIFFDILQIRSKKQEKKWSSPGFPK